MHCLINCGEKRESNRGSVKQRDELLWGDASLLIGRREKGEIHMRRLLLVTLTSYCQTATATQEHLNKTQGPAVRVGVEVHETRGCERMLMQLVAAEWTYPGTCEARYDVSSSDWTPPLAAGGQPLCLIWRITQIKTHW